MSDRIREVIHKNANGEISPDELDRICLEVKMESQRLRQENKEYEMERKMKSKDKGTKDKGTVLLSLSYI